MMYMQRCHATLALPPGCQQPKTRGIDWFLEKHGSRKILPGSQNPEGFAMGLEVSFLGDFASHGLVFFKVLVLNFETGVSQSFKVMNLPFYTPHTSSPPISTNQSSYRIISLRPDEIKLW